MKQLITTTCVYQIRAQNEVKVHKAKKRRFISCTNRLEKDSHCFTWYVKCASNVKKWTATVSMTLFLQHWVT